MMTSNNEIDDRAQIRKSKKQNVNNIVKFYIQL